jgi:hypothetical protein
MPSLPFLYLPDAITLILLMIALSMLRSAAVIHIRQELLVVHKEMLVYWLDNRLDRTDRGYLALRSLIESSIRIVSRLSPARLLFVRRLQRRTAKSGALPFSPSKEVNRLIECTADEKGRAKLKRLQLEMNLGLGTFILIGSLSGWFLLFIIIPRMLKRTIAQPKANRTDFFFDMLERMLGHLGRRTLQVGFAMTILSNGSKTL